MWQAAMSLDMLSILSLGVVGCVAISYVTIGIMSRD